MNPLAANKKPGGKTDVYETLHKIAVPFLRKYDFSKATILT